MKKCDTQIDSKLLFLLCTGKAKKTMTPIRSATVKRFLFIILLISLFLSCFPPDEIVTYTLTIGNNGSGITEPAGEITVEKGVPIGITAIPGIEFSFTCWTVTSGVASIEDETSRTTTVTLIQGDAIIRADFAPVEAPQQVIVSNVKASGLEYDNGIRVTWENSEEADSYNIYRYLSKSDLEPDFVSVSTTNYFYDEQGNMNGPLPDIPYYYKVAAVKGIREYEKCNDFAFGIFSSSVDLYEVNNEISDAVEINSEECNALIYSFNHGEAQDIDWYVYKGDNTFMDISVTLPFDSPFDNLLTLEIINNGSKKNLIRGENTLGYSGADDLYFKIYFTVADPDINRIGAYSVKLIFY